MRAVERATARLHTSPVLDPMNPARNLPMSMSSSKIASALILALCSAAALAAGPGKRARQEAARPAALTPASQEQLDAAERTFFGLYACEFNQTMDVGMNPKVPGYVDVKFKGKTMTMKPVLSSTGALRLEDVTGRTLVIQIAVKSMLMDVKVGQRLVDDCVHADQVPASQAPAGPAVLLPS